jgi:AcrR family transcriptional regulator
VARTRRRSTYHHGDLRNALLRAAAELAERDGPEGVTIRSAARMVGVTPTAAYRHFAGHDELLTAVKHEAVTRLGRAMRRYLDRVPRDGDAALAAVRHGMATGRGYVGFAVAEPGLFRTAFFRPKTPTEEAMAERKDDPFQLLSEGLDELVRVGYLAPESRPMAEFAAWSSVHGLAVMLIDGPLLDAPREAREQAITRTLQTLIRGLGDGEHGERIWSAFRAEQG